MHINRLNPMFFALLWFFCSISVATAQVHSAQANGYTINCNLITTTLLPVESARAYGIEQGDSIVLLNVLVQKDDGSTIAADIEVQTTNLLGQVQTVEMRSSEANQAVSYFGTFTAVPERLKFEVSVRPHGDLKPSTMSFEEEVLQ